MPAQVNQMNAASNSKKLYEIVSGAILNQLNSAGYPPSSTGVVARDNSIKLFLKNGYDAKLLTNMVLNQIIIKDTVTIDSSDGDIDSFVNARWADVFDIYS